MTKIFHRDFSLYRKYGSECCVGRMESPFEIACGTGFELLFAEVRGHFGQSSGSARYTGVMDSVWVADGWRRPVASALLKLTALFDVFCSKRGTSIKFELSHKFRRDANGILQMRCARLFQFDEGTEKYDAVMYFCPERNALVDRMGSGGLIEVELIPCVVEGTMGVISGRTWLRLGNFRLRIPAFLQGRAVEWESMSGELGIEVTLSNRLLGTFFGYSGKFSRVESGQQEVLV